MISLLIQIITSWQVIVVTVVILIYLSIVFRVTNPYRKHTILMRQKKVKEKPEAAAPAPKPEAEPEAAENINDELGLEEM